MGVLFGLYKADAGEIYLHGQNVQIRDPNDANRHGIGMVHQHFKLVHNFTVLESIVLGQEDTRHGLLTMERARKKLMALSDQYRFHVEPDAHIADITVGMQQRVEILKMLYRDNDLLIFDEPTAVLTPQEIDELMQIMRRLADEGKSLIFITHKLKEIKAVADRCTVLRKGKCIGTVDVASTTPETMSEMMVGRKVALTIDKPLQEPGDAVLDVRNVSIRQQATGKQAVKSVSFQVRKGEIVSIAGIDGNGQTDLVYGISGLVPIEGGEIYLNGQSVEKEPIRQRSLAGMSHIPEDRQRFGLVLDYTLEQNLILQTYFDEAFQKNGFLRFDAIRAYAESLIDRFDIRSSDGAVSRVRDMSGGNQQKAIVARELDRDADFIMAVQPVRGLDVGAIEYIHGQLLDQRNKGKGILLVSFELEEVMNLSDRILVMYEGEIVADLDPKMIDVREPALHGRPERSAV